MTDAEYEAQRARLLALADKWVHPLGLGWWDLDFAYARDNYEPPDSLSPKERDRSLAYCSVDWRYGFATITWNMVRVEEQTDEKLERAFVHELCVPSGTVVASTEVEATTSRWYAGELVEVRTTAGHLLACTPNHPILTGRGWVPAGDLLVETDDVVSCGDAERVIASIDPNKYQVPTVIEDIAGAFKMPLRAVPLTAKNFDAEPWAGQVKIVSPNGLLTDGGEAKHDEHFLQFDLRRRYAGLVGLPGSGQTREGLFSVAATLPCEIRGTDRSLALFRSGAFHTKFLSEMVVPHGGASIHEPFMHRHDRRSHRLGKGVDGFTGSVPLQEKVNIEGSGKFSSGLFLRPYPYSSISERAGKGGDIDASALSERLLRGPGHVTLDKIVQIRRYPFRGHVHNLQTSQGWYCANGIITHNCHIFLNEMRWARDGDADHMDHEERVATTLTKAILWLRDSLLEQGQVAPSPEGS